LAVNLAARMFASRMRSVVATVEGTL
jgi:hypothetical protein